MANANEIVGFPFDATAINSALGNTAIACRDALNRAETLFQKLTGIADAYFTAAAPTGLGWDATQLAAMRASTTDLHNLYRVANGLQATGASDFFFNARAVMGAV